MVSEYSKYSPNKETEDNMESNQESINDTDDYYSAFDTEELYNSLVEFNQAQFDAEFNEAMSFSINKYSPEEGLEEEGITPCKKE